MKPQVALETTIITHGMPYPTNVETALSVEAAIREVGAEPKTIAILNGEVKVGLTKEEIEALGQASVLKLSTKDLPFAIAKKLSGSTTVAATMHLSHLADIRVFATGGIGGVHRGAEESFDISADLLELARTDVAVVSAGAKSILDISKTLELLETFSVPVIGYQTDRFPAFFTRDSGYPVHHRLDTPEEIAAFLEEKRRLKIPGGTLIVQALPKEKEVARSLIDTALERVEARMIQEGISGKAVTPYLLQGLVKATEGKSLEANVALIHQNARLAAAIALALSQLN